VSELNIYQRINAVMKKVEYVQKDASVSAGAGGSYKAVTHDMVTAVIRPYLVEFGIVVRPELLKGEMLQLKAVKNEAKDGTGHNMHLYSAEYAIHFVNMDKPEDFLTVTVSGHANDSGDKSTGKCLSICTKNAFLKLFSLETGENDEQRFGEPYSPEQKEVYHQLLEEDKAYEFFLFIKPLPHETVTGLVNSFDDGKKSQGKKKAAKMEAEGSAIFSKVVEDVKSLIDQQDISVTELTDEMPITGKRMLMARLSPLEISILTKIKDAQSI
jgi:hypothetical protein